MPCGVAVSMGSRRLRKWAPLGLKLLDHREQMADGTGQAVEPDHDQGVAAADFAEDPSKHRPVAVCPGRVLLVDGAASGGAELVALGIGALLIGGDPGVADQAGGGSGEGRGHGGPRATPADFTIP